ncbi:transposase-like protein [Clostridiales Family XIII bacterium PM5-7]
MANNHYEPELKQKVLRLYLEEGRTKKSRKSPIPNSLRRKWNSAVPVHPEISTNIWS